MKQFPRVSVKSKKQGAELTPVYRVSKEERQTCLYLHKQAMDR